MWKPLSLGVTLALAVSGYPLVASLLALLGSAGSQTPSIVFRLVVAFAVGATLFLNRDELRIRHRGFLLALAFFWVAYVYRVIHDGYLEQSLDGLVDPLGVFVTMIVFVFVPMLAGFCPLDARGTRVAYGAMFLVTGLTALILLVQSGDIIASLVERNNIRFQLEKLNPITIGYVGGTLAVLCAVGLFRRGAGFNPLRVALFVAGGLGGAFLILISASRGPALATIVCLLVYWLVPMRFGRLIVGAALITVLALGVLRAQGFILKQFDLDVSTRFVSAIEDDEEDLSIDARRVAFDGAWRQFQRSPLFGDALLEEETGGYPHNFTLEAFMTTGLLGGVAYLYCMAIVLWSCFRLLLAENGHEWLALLTVFFTVASQTSGTHYGFGPPWMLAVAAVWTAEAMRADATTAVGRRRRRRRRRLVHRSAGSGRPVAARVAHD